MLRDDLADLANSIVTALALNIRPDQIDRAMNSTERLVANLSIPIVVDVDYDTLVVEGGVLHIYPDVYERLTNTAPNLRDELQSVGIDDTVLDDKTVKQMFDRVNANQEFKVGVADIRNGNSLVAGTSQPLTSQSVVAKNQRSLRKRSTGRGHR
jgi:hypothetical protein